MVDRDLIIAKAASVRVHLDRIAAKAGADLQVFMSDRDRQDVVSFNLHLAIENCIDIAAHIISENGWGVPGSASEMFYLLEDRGILDPELTERMIKAVGLRNLIVHEYGKIDLSLLFATVRNNLNDLNSYLSNIFKKLDILP
ncbi:MAG: DUF86 domain-containing protein [Deltaproteobacteria bacterium]|nr:MAG: DUF86 domain-containing protein [Deltaproteobacteria bacterium]